MVLNNIESSKDNNKQEKNHLYHIPTDKINEVLEYATTLHYGQVRKDNTEYIKHPVRVANYISKLELDNLEQYKTILVICGYLHDTLEDTCATYKDIANKFGNVVASLVLELTNNKDLKKEVGKTKYLQLKMTNMTDLALIVKLADRLDNVKDLVNSNEEFRVKYLKETIEILNYILDNREFNEIHINIINEIKTSIFEIIEQYSYGRFIYSGNLFIVNNKIKKKSLPRHW